jgi:hypothetical protein
MPAHGKHEPRAVLVARTFFKACTKLSDDEEDILPQVLSGCRFCSCRRRVEQGSSNQPRDSWAWCFLRDLPSWADFVQEDSVDYKLSAFRLFAELFPEFANAGAEIHRCPPGCFLADLLASAEQKA